MRANISPAEVLAHSFELDEAWSGTCAAGLKECVGAMLQAVRREADQYGDNLAVCSLIAIAVDMASAGNDNFRVALMLRNCARILEIEGRYE